MMEIVQLIVFYQNQVGLLCAKRCFEEDVKVKNENKVGNVNETDQRKNSANIVRINPLALDGRNSEKQCVANCLASMMYSKKMM